MLLALMVLLPAALGVAALFIPSVRVALAILLLGALVHLAGTVLLWAGYGHSPLGFVFQLDTTGLLFLSITSVLFALASLYTVPYVLEGTHDEQAAPHRFIPCLLWFLSAMTLVTTTQHMAVLWAAIEATTLASAPLVYFYKRREALEAAWKYLLLCSVGIALALLGTFFLGVAAPRDMTVASLVEAAPRMHATWLKAAFVLALVGYGTKMGLAPLHAWLPDAHSQAPSPVSALLSGSVLNCALVGILRFQQVCLASQDAAFVRPLLLVLGFASIAVATAFMFGQRDYKRLFAYSSVENMGIIAVGIGVGGMATYGALLHAMCHSLCKAGLFFLAGNILRAFGTTTAANVQGVFGRLPVTGALLAVLFLALGGAPPFGPFFTELLIFRAALDHSLWLGVLFVTLLALAFLGMASVLFPMLHGIPQQGGGAQREAPLSVLTPLAAAIGVLGLGLYVPPVLVEALHHAVRTAGG